MAVRWDSLRQNSLRDPFTDPFRDGSTALSGIGTIPEVSTQPVASVESQAPGQDIAAETIAGAVVCVVAVLAVIKHTFAFESQAQGVTSQLLSFAPQSITTAEHTSPDATVQEAGYDSQEPTKASGSCVQRLVALGVSEETAQEALDRMRGLPLPELKGRYVSACLCLARYSTVHMEVLRSLPLDVAVRINKGSYPYDPLAKMMSDLGARLDAMRRNGQHKADLGLCFDMLYWERLATSQVAATLELQQASKDPRRLQHHLNRTAQVQTVENEAQLGIVQLQAAGSIQEHPVEATAETVSAHSYEHMSQAPEDKDTRPLLGATSSSEVVAHVSWGLSSIFKTVEDLFTWSKPPGFFILNDVHGHKKED